jgi:hypothetical protein
MQKNRAGCSRPRDEAILRRHTWLADTTGADTVHTSEVHCGGLVSYWKVIKSLRLSVTDFDFNGSFDRLALPEFKTL